MIEQKRGPEEAPIELLYVDGSPSGGIAAIRGADDIALQVVPDAATVLDVVAGERPVDCVICPHALPDADLLSFVGRLRERAPALSILLLSDAAPPAVTAALEAGITDHVRTTPGWTDALADRVRAVVARTGAASSYREVFEAVDAGIVVADLDGNVVDANAAFRRLLDYDRADLADVSLSDLGLTDATADESSEADGAPRRSERCVRTGDGERAWTEVSHTRATIEGEERLLAVLRDVTERKRREQELRDQRAFVDSIIDGLPDALYTFDREGNLLRWNDRVTEVTGYDDAEIEAMDPLEFFPAGEHPRIAAAIATIIHERERLTVESRLRTRDGAEIPYEFTGAPITDETGTVIGLTGTARDVSDRVERERLLERQRDELGRLDRINGVIRSILRSLLDAGSREEIEQQVCDHLGASAPYPLAWIGEYSAAEDRMVSRASAGVEAGYIDDIEIRIDDSETGRGPAGRAVRTREVQVAQRITDDPDFGPWRENALDRGYESSAAVPILSGASLYGVLNVYADRPDAFDEEEQAVLAELGEAIGYAMTAVERKRALMTDSVIELELRFEGHFSRTVARRTGGVVRLDGVVPQPDGGAIEYLAVDGADDGAVVAALEAVPAVEEVRSTADASAPVEVRVAPPSLASRLAELGATVRTMTADPDCTVVAEVSSSVDVRSLVDGLRETFPEVTLLARRERERSLRTPDTFRSRLDERLTARQRTALEAAYRAGYFERPRRRTGQEVAASLDISPSTFTQHLRAGEGKLLSLVFDE